MTVPPVVVFDAFGTLVEIGTRRSPYRALMRWMKECGRTQGSDDAARMLSHPCGIQSIPELFGMVPPPDLIKRLESDLAAEIASIRLFEDSLATIGRLHAAKRRVALCSNLAFPYGAPVKTLLPGLDAYALSFEVGYVKPDQRMYRSLIDLLGCSPQDVLFIGDSLGADLDGPVAFGMQARLIQRKKGQCLADVIAGFERLDVEKA